MRTLGRASGPLKPQAASFKRAHKYLQLKCSWLYVNSRFAHYIIINGHENLLLTRPPLKAKLQWTEQRVTYFLNTCSQGVQPTMTSSGMWRSMGLVRPNVSEGRIASTFRVKNPRARESVADCSLANCYAFRSSRIFSTLRMEWTRSSETSDLIRATRRHIPEDGIIHSYRCENLKSYKTHI
jgi:hypothetical protein